MTATADATTDEIGILRARIDRIDDMIIDLCRERAAVSQRIGQARLASGGTRVVLVRENQILRRFHEGLGEYGTELGLLLLRAGRGPLDLGSHHG